MRYFLTKNFVLTSIAILLLGSGMAQNNLTARQLEQKADSFYTAKNYPSAAQYYLALAAQSDFAVKRSGALYNAACCFSLQDKKDSAFIILKQSVKAGYSNKKNLLADPDLKTCTKRKHGLKLSTV
ncbi:TPR end-of-group domain-containing protein [Ferruginibacter sp.]